MYQPSLQNLLKKHFPHLTSCISHHSQLNFSENNLFLPINNQPLDVTYEGGISSQDDRSLLHHRYKPLTEQVQIQTTTICLPRAADNYIRHPIKLLHVK